MRTVASPISAILLASCGGLLPEYTATVNVDREASAYLEWTSGIVLNDRVYPDGKLIHVGEASAEQPVSLVFHREMFGGALPESVRFYVLASDSGMGALVRCELNEVAKVEAGDWTQPPAYMADVVAGNVVTGMDEELVIMALGQADDVTTTNTDSGTVKHLSYGTGLQVIVANGRVSSVERR